MSNRYLWYPYIEGLEESDAKKIHAKPKKKLTLRLETGVQHEKGENCAECGKRKPTTLFRKKFLCQECRHENIDGENEDECDQDS